ncbi:methyltransferase domain-containing protein [Aurantimonas sp. C2-6-R+9]|uniref:class I SAM-dependent methyltransferase n=1 Tax=unclassified Aurantimonas TaxID=2638230 RepID=UPI002E1962B3|nr:methyltransferase domain-containing protein [Aurantimonas sp. C2-6-R+9]
MTDNETYYDYLRGRSLKGLLYRRYMLYPRLSLELSSRVLDIGCGIGDFLAFRAGTVGVDVNPKLVAHCRARGLEAYVMPFDALPFEEASFDGAVLDNVLEHIAEPGPLLAQAHRVLKPGGTLVVGVPGEIGYRADPDHKVYYDEARLTERLAQSGFTLRRVFHMPARSALLARALTQYCLYGAFERR